MRPDINDLVIALAVSHQTGPVLILNVSYFGCGLVENQPVDRSSTCVLDDLAVLIQRAGNLGLLGKIVDLEPVPLGQKRQPAEVGTTEQTCTGDAGSVCTVVGGGQTSQGNAYQNIKAVEPA